MSGTRTSASIALAIEGAEGSARTWVATAEDLDSAELSINGQIASLTEGGSPPALEGRDSTGTLVLPGQSWGFAHYAELAACR